MRNLHVSLVEEPVISVWEGGCPWRPAAVQLVRDGQRMVPLDCVNHVPEMTPLNIRSCVLVAQDLDQTPLLSFWKTLMSVQIFLGFAGEESV